MTTAADPGAGTLPVLLAERDAVRAFVTLLEREEDALVRGDIDGLAALTPDKASYCVLLEQLESRRIAAGEAAARDPVWAEILELARRARDLNRTNGIVLQQRSRLAESALRVLIGSTRESTTYGPDGMMHSRPGMRGFVAG